MALALAVGRGRGTASVDVPLSMPRSPIPGTGLPRISARFWTRSGLLFGSKFRKKCKSFVRTLTDPDFLRGLGTSDAAAIPVKLASSLGTARHAQNDALSRNDSLPSVVCLKRRSVRNGAQGVAPFVQNDGRFSSVALRSE